MAHEKIIYSDITTSNTQGQGHAETVFVFDCSPADRQGRAAEVDEDGDLIVARKRLEIKLQHVSSSGLADVGLQVWSGALLLADYILSNQEAFLECTALEVGAGTGLAGIVLSRLARRVFLTDCTAHVLQNCQRNVTANTVDEVAGVRFLDFEFATPRDPGRCAEDAAAHEYGWSPEDCAELRDAHFILAADVIYDNDVTLAFMQSMERFLQPWPPSTAGPVLLVAVEKRINFTLRDCAATAHACDYFRSLFRSQPLGGSAALAGGTEHAGMQLEGQQIPVDAIPQRHIHRRPDAMELWRLRWAGQHSLG